MTNHDSSVYRHQRQDSKQQNFYGNITSLESLDNPINSTNNKKYINPTEDEYIDTNYQAALNINYKKLSEPICISPRGLLNKGNMCFYNAVTSANYHY